MSSSSSSSTRQNGAAALQDPVWSTDYVDEDHLKAFAQALSLSDTQPIEGDVSPFSPRSPPIPADPSNINLSHSRTLPTTWKYGPDKGALGTSEGQGRVEKLTATSDFAPIHQRVSRRPARSYQQGLTYHLIRWPLLAFIFAIIYFEFGAYVLTRQTVNVFEWLVAWRGHKAKLRKELRNAKTYDEWVAAAKKLDAYLGFDEWKEIEEDSYFDYTLVRRVRRTLTRLRIAKDTRGLMDALAVCVRSNFAGTESVKMYSESFYGTKYVVESHIREVVAGLNFVRNATDVSMEEKRAFFRAINKHYGSSALCLSGGASFGYYHFGVIKAFLEADLLPRVITGTSAGGLVAALLCTRTNEELKVLLVPELADKITACEDPMRIWLKRFWQTGARFDTVTWARKSMFFTGGSLTFKEAYERTGRALNVSVVPSDRHSPTILLNHLTAPNCIIWSAILASAAVPGILNPVVLMAKDRSGNLKPHNLGGSRFKDGSLREDIPLGSLHTQFNCNFSIVSQTNPHIHLFFFAPRGSVGRPVTHRKGKGWRGGFILSALESYIKLDLSKHFKVIRDLDLMPQILQSDWSGVFLQRFSGDLTLTPKSTIRDWFSLLSDPDRKSLNRMLHVGERVAWPALGMVRNRMAIERAILQGRSEARTAMHRDKTDNDAGSTTRQPDLLGVTDQVPIESDADAGFLSRTRRAKNARAGAGGGAGPGGLAITGLSENEGRSGAVAGPSASGTLRKRGRRRGSEAGANGDGQRSRDEGDRSPRPVVTPEQNTALRNYSISLGETLRHVRAPSLSSLSSPFRAYRSSRSSPTSGPQQLPDTTGETSRRPSAIAIAGGGEKPRSQLSLRRWFGGVSDSSSDSDDELRVDSGSGSASGHSASGDGDERERRYDFGAGAGLDTAVLDDDDPEPDEGGSVPFLGGERASQGEVDGSAAAEGRRLRAQLVRTGEERMNDSPRSITPEPESMYET